MNVQKLVKRAKKGNKEALLQLIMNQKDNYYRLAYSFMGNEHDAMDALEDMIVTLYEKIIQLNREDAFYSWSKTILVNCCRSLLRKRKKLVLMDEWKQDSEEGLHTTTNPYLHKEHQIDILQMLDDINEDQREAIILKYLRDLDYETIAEITGVSIGTVKSRVFNGLKKLNSLHGGEVNEKY